MNVLVVGGSGATGRLLVRQLLNGGLSVTAIVRSPEKFIEILGPQEHLSVVSAAVLDLSDEELVQYVGECEAVASCLGHTLSLKGVYGHPRRLVSDATRRLCKAITASKPKKPVKFVLMNSTGCRNHDLAEVVSLAESGVVGLLRWLVPPHADNEQAAAYLRSHIGLNDACIEWCVVRPDSLVDIDDVSKYEIHPSPIRSAIFNSGKTSRINVAHFMAELITNDAVWKAWKGATPVIYNVEE
ncbi:NAD(P)-binding oxidoreductase [Zhongshania borealis]|uniref:SDR family oxidoreductase n=1 Tax=Zhongshania borealis TaxID=889488 RepID=A0ABP7W7D3_9GAMM